MTVKEILIDWLTTHGYDGLCNVDQECGCLLDDLMPCEGYCNCPGCQPGLKGPPNPDLGGEWAVYGKAAAAERCREDKATPCWCGMHKSVVMESDDAQADKTPDV